MLLVNLTGSIKTNRMPPLDFDEDRIITRYDIEQATIALTKEGLEQDERDVVVEKVLDEATNDNNGCITPDNFYHVISRAPDFLRYFLVIFTNRSHSNHLLSFQHLPHPNLVIFFLFEKLSIC